MIQRVGRKLDHELRATPALGAAIADDGIEFRLMSRDATAVELLLYSAHDPEGEPTAVVPMDRTGDVWHVFVQGLGHGQAYAYRVAGVDDPAQGKRFEACVALVDPWAKAFTTNQPAAKPERSRYMAHPTRRARSVAVDDSFDWQQVGRPGRSLQESVIYEVHLRGMTAHPSSGAADPGTYRGFIERLPYLRDLGVTAIELLPIHEFDRREFARLNPLTEEPLVNYWGYSTIGFFAPNGAYAASSAAGGSVEEFRTLTREAHRHGLEVILDVVYNHTAEGHHMGPMLHMKGLANDVYYHLEADKRFYRDYSGCGNSVNCNHPIVRQFIMDSLRYWTTQMGVDGFRFDLASVLTRDRHGAIDPNSPLTEEIAQDPILRDVKIIAEAWDAAGAFQVGHFPGGRWAEWNGRYRDDIRQFWKGDHGRTGALATRLMGSSDLYQKSGRRPWHSVNFVTCHDGFTMADLVSYNHKHNRANGEDDRDGENHNNSWNCGHEGPTDQPRIESLRQRQIKNLLATLFVSQGTPMLLGGDEFRRTQRGNNNAYCQDNEISWFDWELLEKNRELHRFVKELIWFRRRHPVFHRANFFLGKHIPGRRIMDVTWYENDGSREKIWEQDDQTLMCGLDGAPPAGGDEQPDNEMLILFNASPYTRHFNLAPGQDGERPWHLVIDTGNKSPRDFYPEGLGPRLPTGSSYPLIDRSFALFTRRFAD
ncbi:MAG TPA: glycogen debranching protein GlgX [Planctomycetia bacterium]|nr:glycogen debranching protein GlgX [Planctomycetia bacterium]